MSAEADDIVVVRGDLDAVAVRRLVDGGDAKALIWPGMGARFRSMHRFRLPAGAATIPFLHESDSVYFVIEGAAEFVDLATGETIDGDSGSAMHIDAGTSYQIRATKEPASVVGGACPADPQLYVDIDKTPS